jgi:predicted N-acetyltransferase YhbS
MPKRSLEPGMTTPREVPQVRQPLSCVEKLAARHFTGKFRSGKQSMDLFLKRNALRNQDHDSSQTYVVHRDNHVIGYYSMSYGAVDLEECPEAIRDQMPDYPVPVMVLARLAVNRNEQGNGLGKALLKDALLRIASAAEIAGLRAVLVHAIDAQAKTFYKRFGFQDSSANDLQVMMSIQDVRATIQAAAEDIRQRLATP